MRGGDHLDDLYRESIDFRWVEVQIFGEAPSQVGI